MELGPLAPKISLLNFYPPHVVVGPACSDSPCFCISTEMDLVDRCGFFSSVVVRLPFNSISDGSGKWLFSSLVVILMRLCEEVSRVSLHLCLDWKAQIPLTIS